MSAYRRVYDSRHLLADCQEPGSAPEPYARQSSMGYLFLLTYMATVLVRHTYRVPVAVVVSSVMHFEDAPGATAARERQVAVTQRHASSRSVCEWRVAV